ncbi:hypothetical protein OF83DRAFT_1066291 [Amylostereum chailletii]|nr:hypothetical protein OF83DRAFT_1066291 [Amylostereum chailletii]
MRKRKLKLRDWQISGNVELRRVRLPPQTLDNCAGCGAYKPKGRKLCACNEATYCSADCQREDRRLHKSTCVPTPHVDLTSFYPLLALLVDISHGHPSKPYHHAFDKSIVNDPRPGSNPVYFDDGWEANPVILMSKGRLPRPLLPSSLSQWWPQVTPTQVIPPPIRRKLYLRILREGYVLPILTSVCVALLSEAYTRGTHAPRLRYKTGTVADFGIVSGSARVTNQDKLGYVDMDVDPTRQTRGQDPEDHYWIYFRTVRGEELTLDCAMFTFSMNMVVTIDPYVPRQWGEEARGGGAVPGYFQAREIRQTLPVTLHTERTRKSIMRNVGLQTAVARGSVGSAPEELFNHTDDERAVTNFMADLAGRTIAPEETKLAMDLVRGHTLTLREVFEDEEWRQYPEEPQLGVMDDPGELDEFDKRKDAWWRRQMREQKRLRQQGGKKSKHA